SEEARLAGAVRAEHSDLRPVVERDRDVGQHGAVGGVATGELVGRVEEVRHAGSVPPDATHPASPVEKSLSVPGGRLSCDAARGSRSWAGDNDEGKNVIGD